VENETIRELSSFRILPRTPSVLWPAQSLFSLVMTLIRQHPATNFNPSIAHHYQTSSEHVYRATIRSHELYVNWSRRALATDTRGS
jgi:hypothetical protein